MKQRYAVVVLFVLITASSMVSLTSYRATEQLVTDDMNQALAKALAEVFNSHLQIEGLRGNAILAVDTKKGFCPRPQVSTATILSLSDQRPSMILWSMAMLWGLFCLYQHRRNVTLGLYGGLALQNGHFVDARGNKVKLKLTPMQQQLMEMLWKSPTHQLSKTEICNTLWPKKPDANETLYTLIRRLKPIIEQHSDLKIEADRGKSYGLTIK